MLTTNEVIIEAFDRSGFSVARFCAVTGYTTTYINAVFKNQLAPKIGTCINICQKLGFAIRINK